MMDNFLAEDYVKGTLLNGKTVQSAAILSKWFLVFIRELPAKRNSGDNSTAKDLKPCFANCQDWNPIPAPISRTRSVRLFAPSLAFIILSSFLIASSPFKELLLA